MLTNRKCATILYKQFTVIYRKKSEIQEACVS